ncbi:MAG: RidA family protein [Acetobacteraceae bacterium]|nr:RidA family protein [Acetobacteraceae bacterium]
MPISLSNPDGVFPPGSRYSHAALVEGAKRRLVVSGQVGLTPDGHLDHDGEAQIGQALANLGAILSAHGMGPRNVAKVTVFLTDRELVPLWREARDAFFAGHAPASTLLVVAGLADPRFQVEVEAEAAD